MKFFNSKINFPVVCIYIYIFLNLKNAVIFNISRFVCDIFYRENFPFIN